MVPTLANNEKAKEEVGLILEVVLQNRPNDKPQVGYGGEGILESCMVFNLREILNMAKRELHDVVIDLMKRKLHSIEKKGTKPIRVNTK